MKDMKPTTSNVFFYTILKSVAGKKFNFDKKFNTLSKAERQLVFTALRNAGGPARRRAEKILKQIGLGKKQIDEVIRLNREG